MEAKFCSKYLLRKLLEDFSKYESELTYNKEYLENHVSRLEDMIMTYRSQSRNPSISSRHRSRARDLEQNAMGLLNGIKFSLSFMHYQDEDLEKIENDYQSKKS